MQKDQYILGINGLGVLPSACILKNGQLVAMAEEERFTRIKGSFGMMPAKASKYCLEEANINFEDISEITFAWDCPYYKFKMPAFLLKQLLTRASLKQSSGNIFRVIAELVKYQPNNVRKQLKEMFVSVGISNKLPKITFVNHHLAHAASSFYSSGFNQAHILVIDGSGENTTTSIWFGKDKELIQEKSFKIPDSLGWFYQSITEYLGFMPNNHEGKTMALAAYGRFNEKIQNQFHKIIQCDDKGNYKFNPNFSFAGNRSKGLVFSDELEQLLGPARCYNEEITQRHKDIAFMAQKTLEDITFKIAQNIAQQDNFKGNLCIAGGVGLNCKMNYNFLKIDAVKNIYIPPFTNDTGSALGAAQSIAFKNKQFKREEIRHAYWGPKYTNEEIEIVLKKTGLKYTKEQDISKKIAELLVENKVVAWFQGRMEVGSRALGARSILANPSNPKIRDIINEKVKNRELWRPFAASFLDEKQKDFFLKKIEAPFMTLAMEVKDESLDNIASAIHIDKTTRPQIVQKKTNLKYWKLIKYFGDISGIYAVLNTSFNLKEEPIICTPEQALKSFLISNIDALAIEDFLIIKRL